MAKENARTTASRPGHQRSRRYDGRHVAGRGRRTRYVEVNLTGIEIHIAHFVPVIFVLAMSMIFITLVLFLRELGVAARRMQIGLEFTVAEYEDRGQ